MDSPDRRTFYQRKNGVLETKDTVKVFVPSASEEEGLTSTFALSSDEFRGEEIIRTGNDQRVLERFRRMHRFSRCSVLTCPLSFAS